MLSRGPGLGHKRGNTGSHPHRDLAVAGPGTTQVSAGPAGDVSAHCHPALGWDEHVRALAPGPGSLGTRVVRD
jgi:hypothetical protein